MTLICPRDPVTEMLIELVRKYGPVVYKWSKKKIKKMYRKL